MSAELLAKLAEKRKLEVVVGHITFTGECPLYAKLMGIISKCKDTANSADAEMAVLAVTGWEGMTEADVIAGGDPSRLIPFSRELCDNLIRDRVEWWTPISVKITESVMSRQIQKEDELKNFQAGTITKPLSD